MAQQKTFGRRTHFPGEPQRRPQPPRVMVAPAPAPLSPVAADVLSGHSLPPMGKAGPPPLDRELEEWKKARKRTFKIPYRQLLLIASLCFGIASLVLPDSVNDNVDLLLYALMAASFYAWLSGCWRKS
jgi:hypothetical protein